MASGCVRISSRYCPSADVSSREALAREILLGEAEILDLRAHRAVDHEDTLAGSRLKRGAVFRNPWQWKFIGQQPL